MSWTKSMRQTEQWAVPNLTINLDRASRIASPSGSLGITVLSTGPEKRKTKIWDQQHNVIVGIISLTRIPVYFSMNFSSSHHGPPRGLGQAYQLQSWHNLMKLGHTTLFPMASSKSRSTMMKFTAYSHSILSYSSWISRQQWVISTILGFRLLQQHAPTLSTILYGFPMIPHFCVVFGEHLPRGRNENSSPHGETRPGWSLQALRRRCCASAGAASEAKAPGRCSIVQRVVAGQWLECWRARSRSR